MENSIHHSNIIFNRLKKLNLCRIYSHTSLKHIMAVLISVFSLGFKGKTVNFERFSPCHRTTIAHFLNHGKWDEHKLEDILKASVAEAIYSEAKRSGCPVFCIVDDTISSKAKPSSQALHPIEDAYFHQSHLKKKQDYGHQAVAVMLSCNGITLNYAVIMYDKSISKIQIVKNIAAGLPEPPVISYFLCDSWYTSAEVMKAFLKKGFYTIGALKTNRIIYPCGIRQKINEYALYLRKTDADVSLVTAGSRQYYVYRYEGSLNGIENASVLLSYPKDAFHNPKALKAFICTDVSLGTQEILDRYMCRWSIEIYFRQSKDKLAFSQYQIRSSKGIRRYWLIMSLAHFICCTEAKEEKMIFGEGYKILQKAVQKEQIEYIYQCGVKGIPLENVLRLAG